MGTPSSGSHCNSTDVSAAMLLIGSPLALVEALEERGLDTGAFRAFATVICQVAILAAIPVLLFLFARKARKWGVELESQRWMTERQSGITPAQRKSRTRAIRLSLWIPSLIVLIVFLFLPEIWGMATHIQHHRAGRLEEYDFPFTAYEVKIPPTWIIQYQHSDATFRDSWVFGMAGRGMAFGVTPYISGSVPLSSWGIRTKPYNELADSNITRWVLKRYRPTRTQDFLIGDAVLSCQEYSPLEAGVWRTAASPAYIECTLPQRFFATFEGEKVHVPDFYKMVASVRPSPPEIEPR